MNEMQNLNAYYTTNSKVEKPVNNVAMPPATIPKDNILNAEDLDKKMNAINQDIYEGTQAQKSKTKKNFIKFFAALVLSIIAICGLRKLFKF